MQSKRMQIKPMQTKRVQTNRTQANSQFCGRRETRLAGAVLVLGLLAQAAGAQSWIESERAAELMRDQKYDEAAEIYARLAAENPQHGNAWSQLGYCLHAQKNYEQALPAYAKAIELGFSRPGNLYNSACAYALLGRPAEALDWLEKALKERFADQETLEKDTDMDSLRGEARFAELTGLINGLAKKPAEGRADGWRWDLDFCVRRMEQMHWDLYDRVPSAKLRAEVDQLKRNVDKLDDDRIRARLRRITALVGDGHTASRLQAEGEPIRRLPIHMFQFQDGLYVIGADPAQAELVGAEVTQIGPLTASAAMKAVRPYICVDNEMGYLAAGPEILTSWPILLDLNCTDGNEVAVTVKLRESQPRVVRLAPVERTREQHQGLMAAGWTYVHDNAGDAAPLFLRDPKRVHRMEYLPDRKLVYFWFGAVTNTREGTLKDFLAQLFKFIDEHEVEQLVIDMRFNGGGNTGLVRPLLDGLIRSDKVNRRGHLWVVIGRQTFSAAQNTVNLLDYETQALFVGEPTGSRPAFVGESTWFLLPHSRTRVHCSSRYWQYLDSTDQRTWVPPDVPAAMTFADYVANRDPAMEAIYREIDTAVASSR